MTLADNAETCRPTLPVVIGHLDLPRVYDNQPMFRRIEFIHPSGVEDDGEAFPPWKDGLQSVVTGPVLEAWIYDLTGPSRASLPTNCRFYFTEKGWREVGLKVLAAARQTGQDYRVVAIKETDAQVLWRDKARGFEVAVQPASRRRPA